MFYYYEIIILNERFAWGEACASFWWQPAPSVTKSLGKWHLAPKIEQKRGSEQRELCDILRVKLCQNVCVGNACASIPCASFIPSATSIMVSHVTCHNTCYVLHIIVWKQQQDAKFQRAHLFPSTQRTLQPSLLRSLDIISISTERSIFDLCRNGERRRGTSSRRWWWDQLRSSIVLSSFTLCLLYLL